MSFRKYVSPYALELGDLESGDCFVEGQRGCTRIEETPAGIRCSFEREGKVRTVLCLQGVLDSGWVELDADDESFKPDPQALRDAAERALSTPRRGRPPGSKNKLKGDS